MIEKVAEYIQDPQEPSILTILDDKKGMEKTAGYASEVERYINSLEKENGYLYALINALTAGEYYGPNKNGDYFPEQALKERHHTFQDGGYVYKHHVNKDPKKSMGRVIFSHYNDNMKRVEIVVKLKKDHPDVRNILQKMSEGQIVKTSMGARVPYDVCFSLDTPIFSNEGYKDLDSINVGDIVLDEYNQEVEIISTLEREVEDFYELQVFGDYEPIKVSKDHPFLSIPGSKFKRSSNSSSASRIYFKKSPEAELDFKPVQDLEKGDYLAYYRFKSNKDIFSLSHAKIFGYWLAEGSFVKEQGKYISALSFSFSNDEQYLVDDLEEACSSAGFTFKSYSYPGKNEISCRVYNRELSNEVKKYFGEYSEGKYIHPTILKHSDEFLKTLLGAYIDGDGSFDYKKKNTRFCTASPMLARSIRRLCFQIGVSCSVHKEIIDTTFSKNLSIYCGFFGKGDSREIQDYCFKIKDIKKTKKSSRLFIYENYVLIPVSDIKKIEEPITVKNIQTSGTETYQAHEYIVHNCSITGKKAKTRAQYSPYLKNQMNKVLSDGRRVFAINTKPTFFDISIVTIPADPVSSFMKVFGMEKIAEDKHGQISKKIEGEVDWITDDPNNVIFDSQAPIKDETLKKLAEYPMSDVLSTFLGLRILPTRDDFQKLALYKTGQHELAQELEKVGHIFSVDPQTYPEELEGVSLENANEKIASELNEEILDISLTKPLIINRIIKQANFVSSADNSPEKRERSFIKKILFDEPTVMPNESGVKNPLVPFTVLGTMYAGYAQLFGNTANASQFAKFVKTHPWVGPLIGGGVALGLTKMQEDVINSGTEKTAAYPAAFALAAPISYYTSAKAEVKARRGEPLNNVENAVRKNPFITSLVGGLALGRAGSSFRKSMVRKGLMSPKTNVFTKSKDYYKSKNFNKHASYLEGLNKETINLIFKELTS